MSNQKNSKLQGNNTAELNRRFNILSIKTAKVDDIIKLEDAEEYLNYY